MTNASNIAQLRAMARYRRERLALYRAKVHGPRATSPAHLAQLKREHELSESHLKRAIAPAAGRDPDE